MHYFQFEIKEWLANTSHLNEQEESYYLRLILYYYDSEKAIPLDPSPVFRKLRIKDFDVGIAILHEFFTECESGFVHDRCNLEIAKYHAKSEQASRAGKASAEKRFNSRSTAVQPIINQESLIINHKSIKKPPPEGFELFWNVYDKKVGKPNAIKQWQKIKPDAQLITMIVIKAEADKVAKPDNKYRKDPERWLKGQHWLDEVIVEQAVKAKELPLGTEQQIEEAYRVECGGDPRLARFNSYFEMKKFIMDTRDKRKVV